MDARRDGSPLTDLAIYLREMRDEVRGLSHRIRAARKGKASPAAKRRATRLERALEEGVEAMHELFHAFPHGTLDRGDAGVLCLGLVAQWIGRRAEHLARAQEGMHGHSSTLDVASVAALVAMQEKSGLLRVETNEETFLLEFVAGDVVHAVSDRTPEEDRLGRILVGMGELAEQDLEALVAKAADSRRRLGQLLRDESVVTKKALKAALGEQVQRLFRRLFTCDDATFTFTEDATDHDLQKVRLGVTSLLLDSAREFVEGQLGSEPEPEPEDPTVAEIMDGDIFSLPELDVEVVGTALGRKRKR